MVASGLLSVASGVVAAIGVGFAVYGIQNIDTDYFYGAGPTGVLVAAVALLSVVGIFCVGVGSVILQHNSVGGGGWTIVAIVAWLSALALVFVGAFAAVEHETVGSRRLPMDLMVPIGFTTAVCILVALGLTAVGGLLLYPGASTQRRTPLRVPTRRVASDQRAADGAPGAPNIAP